MPVDRTQSEYRAIERLLSPRLQEMLDRAFDEFRKKADEKDYRDIDQKSLWKEVLDGLPISHTEAMLLDIANSIWSGTEIQIPVLQLHSFDEQNRIRFIKAISMYLGIGYIINEPEKKCHVCGKSEDEVHFLIKDFELRVDEQVYKWICPECAGFDIITGDDE